LAFSTCAKQELARSEPPPRMSALAHNWQMLRHSRSHPVRNCTLRDFPLALVTGQVPARTCTSLACANRCQSSPNFAPQGSAAPKNSFPAGKERKPGSSDAAGIIHAVPYAAGSRFGEIRAASSLASQQYTCMDPFSSTEEGDQLDASCFLPDMAPAALCYMRNIPRQVNR
jgi:hypothetical protein